MRFRSVVRTLRDLALGLFADGHRAAVELGCSIQIRAGNVCRAAAHRLGLALLASPEGAMASLIGVNVWASYPMAALLFLAARADDPGRPLRSDADGRRGGPVSLFRYITLPMIRPTLVVMLIQLTLLYFNMVTLIYVLTGGGPARRERDARAPRTEDELRGLGPRPRRCARPDPHVRRPRACLAVLRGALRQNHCDDRPAPASVSYLPPPASPASVVADRAAAGALGASRRR